MDDLSWECVYLLSRFAASLFPSVEVQIPGRQGGFVTSFRGVGVEVRIKATCRGVLPPRRTVDEASLVLFVSQGGRPRETQGGGRYFPARWLKRPRGSLGERLWGGLPGVRSPFGLLKLTVSHCSRWRDRFEV